MGSANRDPCTPCVLNKRRGPSNPPGAMPSLEFDEKPKHLSRFDLSGEPASSSPSKPKAKIVEIG